ncbi:MAG: 4-hydroxy-tetrahydrodipicolinate synthase [Runella slithyformis]|nr:MAG: 4-hydroxy-tetrahydrodipicolinate synthase [Runella sp.]TAG23604.1 MAG: 4-hydroxy-tetrahydrodipicolinate synthase [Cytophagales bacterium]TAG42775.1 MAG: 4-hydroxy-tetrahydrodipicolinate synthase [Cytophagia bacterium]TAG51243.1 MAG: 4-hydroxy-tetrahydrodipicolinate synthase [Runella slithyformis]TAG72344.1 MAG: 4-hydroxy-tetrahydrodipicolinate synthase [Runella slithyformis]
MYTFSKNKFHGVGVALVTPFDSRHNIDFEGLRSLIMFVSNNGADYLVVQGTTGETSTTTSEEKTALLQFVQQNNTKKLPIVYGLGGNNTQVVLDTLKNTDLTGVDAILSVCPYYNKPAQRGLVAHFTAIADASPVPVLLYNVPGRTVTNMSVETIVALAQHPNIIGLKDACGSFDQYLELSKRCPADFLLISGDDNHVTPMISVGWHGVISVIANAFPKEMSDMTWHALHGRFREATKMQHQFFDFDGLLYAESNPVGIKQCLAIKQICGNEVRLPLVKASDELAQKLQTLMAKEGFNN